jgi:predicted transcriptional regulator
MKLSDLNQTKPNAMTQPPDEASAEQKLDFLLQKVQKQESQLSRLTSAFLEQRNQIKQLQQRCNELTKWNVSLTRRVAALIEQLDDQRAEWFTGFVQGRQN